MTFVHKTRKDFNLPQFSLGANRTVNKLPALHRLKSILFEDP